MVQTVNIGGNELILSNRADWAIIYRDQFNHDIIPTVMPLLAGLMDILGGLLGQLEVNNGKELQVNIGDLIQAVSSEGMFDALIHMSGFEYTELYNITWAMNKTAVNDIPEPKQWIRQFEDGFPLDEAGPVLFEMMAKGMMSSKNWKRLESLKMTLQPSILIQSSQPQQNEDSASET